MDAGGFVMPDDFWQHKHNCIELVVMGYPFLPFNNHSRGDIFRQ